ncbi:MAG: hypothetical protein QNJ68_08715 [Microcoleaceae cyanobacterium MO_207.B10]|nr:hypothetical protein [Microcoleaceae cyanobacterium MO_207.B10]
MQSTYIVLLTLSVGSVWIYNRTSEDISFVLAILTGLVCFFWGFACSPLLVQLLIIFGILGLYRFNIADRQGLG